ncbi:MAG TPA: ABC transporter permease subunit [Anaerolineae bacterium]|nr:ABC transporter permease subunit [Anaerolineae bacterium]
MQKTLSGRTSASPVAVPRPSLFNRKTGWVLLFIAGVIWALLQAGLLQHDFVNPGGWERVRRFLAAGLNPDLSPDFLRLTLDATITTLAFAVCGTFFSLIFGFVAGIFASEVWWQSILPGRVGGRSIYRAPWLAVRSVLAFLRAIHEIIWGLFFISIIGLDPLSAVLAIAIPFGAVTGKVFSEILDEMPRQPYLVLRNSGVPPTLALTYTLVPQAFLDALSYAFYRFECSIRAAAVLGIIGAGGLGHEIFLSLQSLRYEQIWTLFLALFALNGLTDLWSGLLRRRLGAKLSCSGADCVDIDSPMSGTATLQLYRYDRVVRASLIIAALLIPFSFWYIQPNFGKLFSERTLLHLGEVARWAFPPDFSQLPLSEWLELSAVTVAMSLLAIAGAGLLALVLCFPSAHNFLLPGGLLVPSTAGLFHRTLGLAVLLIARAILLVARSIPPPVWALLFIFVLFPGILPGAAALGMYTLGILGRLMAEVVENLDDRPLTALKALGARGGDIFTYGILPLSSPRFLAYGLYRWEEAIRATVVVGLVGAGGLGHLLTEQLSSFDYQGVFTTLIVFVTLIFLVDQISAAVRRTFREN